MTAFLLGLLPTIWPYILGAIGLVATFFYARHGGAASERAKQDKARLRAAQERLEMDREATTFEREAAALSDEQAKKEGMAWARKP